MAVEAIMGKDGKEAIIEVRWKSGQWIRGKLVVQLTLAITNLSLGPQGVHYSEEELYLMEGGKFAVHQSHVMISFVRKFCVLLMSNVCH